MATEYEPNILDILSGSPPDAREYASAVSGHLRKKQLLAELMATAPQFKDAAHTMAADVGSQQKLLENAGVGRMHYGDEAQALKRSLAGQQQEGALQRALLAYQGRIGAAKIGAEARKETADAKPPKPLPGADVKALESMNDMHRSVRQLSSEFKPEYAGQSAVGPLKNTWAKYAGSAAGPQAQEQFKFWSKFKMLVENVMRHEMFGSAFTSSEQQAWKDAQLLGPQTDPKIVQERFKDLQGQLNAKLTGRVRGRSKEGYSTEALREFAPEVADSLSEDKPSAATKTRKKYNQKTGEFE